MNTTTYPTMQESQRPVSVSKEGYIIRRHIESSHNIFVGKSVFQKEMYNLQLKKSFNFYKAIWENETIFSSSVTEIINNSAYRAIISLGHKVIPFIIEDLKSNGNHWFYALEALTGENPIKNAHQGDILKMKMDWIEWSNNNLTYEN